MMKVKRPHMKKYAAIAGLDVAVPSPIVGRKIKPTSVSQKRPYDVKAVVPKVLFFFHSIKPANIWAIPP